jgi:chromatin assembly factor 1 subunit A
MEVSVESATATASPLTQSFPGSPNNPRKRTFSKVEDSNTNTAEFRKLQRFDDPDNQENRDPLGPEPMLLDRPSTVDAMPSTTTAPLPSSTIMTADKNTIMPGGQQSELHVVSINPTAHGHALAPTSTPPKDIDATAATAIAIADDKTAKAPPASKEAKRLEKEEKERLKLEEKAKKEEEKRIKEEEKKKKDAEREEEKRKRDAEREEERKKREEKKKIKEEEKQAKDEEKRKREEENEKKERVSLPLQIGSDIV